MLSPPSTTASLNCQECLQGIQTHHISNHFRTPHIIYRTFCNGIQTHHISNHYRTPHIIYRTVCNKSSPISGAIDICAKIYPCKGQFSPKYHINTTTMAGTNHTSQWEDLKFSFSAVNDAKEWKTFYMRVLNYLETWTSM